MSYGPQLPPHLQKQKNEQSDSDDDDGDIGPKLPDQPCLGPRPVSDDEPDDVVVGPLPPGVNDERSLKLEERALKMKIKFAEAAASEGNDEMKRETWMLELPPELSKNFGLGPRGFSRNTGPKLGQDKSWTQAPNSSSKDEETEDPTSDKDVLEYMANLQRDKDMERISNELNQKRGSESLMDRHTKKVKKEKSKRPEERRPFDRDLDLQVNRFDDAQKAAMLKKAGQLNDRFSRGGQKFL